MVIKILKNKAEIALASYLYDKYSSLGLKNFAGAETAHKKGLYEKEKVLHFNAKKSFEKASGKFLEMHSAKSSLHALVTGGMLKKFSAANSRTGEYKPNLGILHDKIKEREKLVKLHHNLSTLSDTEIIMKVFEVEKPSQHIPKLKSYISFCLKNDIPKEEMKKQLSAKGWPEYLVMHITGEISHEQKHDLADLGKFIEIARLKGNDENSIIKKLLDVGWHKDVIDVARFKAHHVKSDTKEMHAYVLNCLKNSMPHYVIKDKLKNLGWDESVIENILYKE